LGYAKKTGAGGRVRSEDAGVRKSIGLLAKQLLSIWNGTIKKKRSASSETVGGSCTKPRGKPN